MFRVTGEIVKPNMRTTFKKEVRALKADNAKEKIYKELGSKHRAKRFQIKILRIEDINEPTKVYALHPAYPNPFNPSTTIEFNLPQRSFVSLKIYNILGEEVTTLVSKELVSGRYKYIWEANNLAGGIYFYILDATEFTKVRKIILLR